MTVSSHLMKVALAAIVRDDERASINRSISTLQARLGLHFAPDLEKHFLFGSYTRGTILPRRCDEKSDVDYMVVFSDGTKRPQTYLNWLRQFTETYYSRSEIAQSHPTVALNLNHIKFELVPAINSLFFGLHIPAPSSNFEDWVSTQPNEVNDELVQKNRQCKNLIKPQIRVIKYWNAISGYPFASFELERHLVDQWYWGAQNLRDYVFEGFRSLQLGLFAAQWKREKLARARDIIHRAEQYEDWGQTDAAEREIKKLIPSI